MGGDLASERGQRPDLIVCQGLATTEIYTLSLHDALPISQGALGDLAPQPVADDRRGVHPDAFSGDAKHAQIGRAHV